MLKAASELNLESVAPVAYISSRGGSTRNKNKDIGKIRTLRVFALKSMIVNPALNKGREKTCYSKG